MTDDTNDEHFPNERLIDKAINDSGRPASSLDEVLINRLRAIHQLLVHNPQVFDSICNDIITLLKRGFSIDFIVSFLGNHQRLYDHAHPQELGLANSLTEIVSPLLSWLDKIEERTDLEKRYWIERFEMIEPMQLASAFFKNLLQRNILIVDHGLMEVFCAHPQEGTQSGHLSINRDENLPLLVDCIGHYQRLNDTLQPMILPLLVHATNCDVSIKKLERLLSLLSKSDVQTKLVRQLPEQIKLLREWWKYALFDRVSIEQIEQVLKIVLHLEDPQEPGVPIRLINTIMQEGIAANISVEKWSQGVECLDFLEKLAPKTLRNHCVALAQHSVPKIFDFSWVARLKTVERLQEPMLANLNDEDTLHALQIYMQCSDEHKTSEYLAKLAKIEANSLVASSIVLEQASFLDEPLPYLQVMSELQQLYMDLPSKGRDDFKKVFNENCSDCMHLRRDKDFLQLFQEVPDLNQDYLKNAYAEWHKKPYCSMSSLRAKKEFSLQIQKQLKGLDKQVIQDMIDAPQQHRDLIQKVVLPFEMTVDEVAAWWSKINERPELQSQAYLHKVIKLQQITCNEFDRLLNFDDPANTETRRALLHSIWHNEIALTQEKEHFWEKYLNALIAWINNSITSKPKVSLNRRHHVQAITSLHAMAYATEELQAIVAPNDNNSMSISEELKQHLQNYKTSYNASWWNTSRDRKKLAYDELFSLLENQGTSYDVVLDALHRVMNGVVNMDKEHTGRNSKGYSRLYDIAVQLMSITMSEALRFDGARSHAYIRQVQNIMADHKQLVGGVDLELPAFQHLQDMMSAIGQPGFIAH